MLITGHRRENFGEGFINMVTAIKDLTEKLCRGHEITFDGKGYADLTTDDN